MSLAAAVHDAANDRNVVNPLDVFADAPLVSGSSDTPLLRDDVARLLVSGTFVLSCGPRGPGVGLVRPGQFEGLQRVAGHPNSLSGRVLTNAIWREVPLQRLSDQARASLLNKAASDAAERLFAAACETGCALQHSIDRRLARWLHAIHGSNDGSHISITQTTLADLLGVRRTTICEASQKMRAAGAFKQMRNRLTISDPSRLEAMACDCGVTQPNP